MSDFIFYLELERWYYFIKFYEFILNLYSEYYGIFFIILFTILPTVILCFLLDKKYIQTILLLIFYNNYLFYSRIPLSAFNYYQYSYND